MLLLNKDYIYSTKQVTANSNSVQLEVSAKQQKFNEILSFNIVNSNYEKNFKNYLENLV